MKCTSERKAAEEARKAAVEAAGSARRLPRRQSFAAEASAAASR